MRLRLGTLGLTLLASFAAGLVGMHAYMSARVARLTEERAQYHALSQTALGMSERAVYFVTTYQGSLELCLRHLYGASNPAPPATYTPSRSRYAVRKVPGTE